MNSVEQLSQQLGELLLKHKQILVTAESCTGGGVANAITEIAGSSAWFDRAFVTYSNEAKQEMIGVEGQTLAEFGAVSEPVVIQMVQGALKNSNATIGVSISGIAGPTGGSEEKPVGTVCFAWADKSEWLKVETQHFTGDRSTVRTQAVIHALETIKEHLS
ncbi:nicotinamide-nucleotide amidase [Vibrio diazotrophicus]|uniref:nicotinamide-nucleotide amidase n=1 Tax=Vibrio diazotrophicus TaxID=685 RepID=UPI000C9E73C7|nr:nicotinamide-nucleotide amidase [Vibrio diazotrophicus]PNH93260.1 damage-inducible protein CinA [Vibrio diazotrophicus]